MRWLICFLIFSTPVFAGIELTIAGRPVQLEEATVDAKLHGDFLIRDLKLVFRNPIARVAEGDLVCPLEEGEEVVSFAMDVHGVRRDAVVVPQKRARHAYETIVARGTDPGLLEVDEAAREFRTRVYPIPSRGTKTVWIRLARLVSEGEITLWPKGLGQPGSWLLNLETKGGKAGAFPTRQDGDAGEELRKTVSWRAAEELSYRSNKGDLRLVKSELEKIKAKTVEVWLDGTVEPTAEALERLFQLLLKLETRRVILRVFREELGEARSFRVRKGKAKKLLRAIDKEERFGLARPVALPWKSVSAEALVVLTDGEFVFGNGGFDDLPCPLHVIDSGKGKSRWLRSRALASGGGWHGSGGLDPKRGLLIEKSSLVGEVFGEIFCLKSAEDGIETPIGDWLWAKMHLAELKASGVAQEELDDFKFEHGVWDSDSAMIVMETASQYFEFGITPPKTDARLFEQWQVLQERRKKRKQSDLSELAKQWKSRCDHLSQSLDPLDDRLRGQVKKRSQELAEFWKEQPGDEPEFLEPLQEKLKEIETLTQDGVDPNEIPSVKKALGEVRDLETRIEVVGPLIQITIGGQVKHPGHLTLSAHMTLGEAIVQAGGATPYGALNRVRLYRRGRVYEFNLRDRQTIRPSLETGDVIEIPQRNLLGNDGGGGGGNAPSAKEGPGTIVFERGEEHPSRYYLDDLENYLNNEPKWWNRYKMFRQACGWRADFYLDVIEFLREKDRPAWALRVTADLAEYMPSNPDVLRKTAMAFRRLGEMEMARDFFARVLELNPESPGAHYDLARSEEACGNFEKALALYWEAAHLGESKNFWGRSDWGRSMVALEDMNALIVRENLDPHKAGIPPGLVRHVPLELRVVLEWDAAQSNLDLMIRRPIGRTSFRGFSPDVEGFSWWSGNATKGLGPDSWNARGLLPGDYEFGAIFYGDLNEPGPPTVTAEVEVIRNFGQENETRARYALRLEEENHAFIVKAKVFPEGWE